MRLLRHSPSGSGHNLECVDLSFHFHSPNKMASSKCGGEEQQPPDGQENPLKC